VSEFREMGGYVQGDGCLSLGRCVAISLGSWVATFRGMGGLSFGRGWLSIQGGGWLN